MKQEHQPATGQLESLTHEMERIANPQQAAFFSKFFKTGKGEYGEDDVFLGLSVPQQRTLAKKYKTLALDDIQRLLESPFHEHRLTALFILVHQYQKVNTKGQENILRFYLRNLEHVNNWDLVDSSSYAILGHYLLEKPKEPLYTFAQSKNIWERRIAIVSTFYFIRKGEYTPTLKIATLLLNDKEDLIHKACGWMLRELGKKDETALRKFLNENGKRMPRTMLRYAIERFDEKTRKKYLENTKLTKRSAKNK